MIRLRDRSDLIALVEHSPCGCPAVRRACVTGGVEVLGGFHKLVAGRDGWLVRVTAKHGAQWLIAITMNVHTHLYESNMLLSVPWEYWIGVTDYTNYHINNGDHPLRYAENRDEARAQATLPVPDSA